MPVRTRSQLRKESQELSSSGTSGYGTSSSSAIATPSTSTISSRRTTKRRTSSRLAKKKTQEIEMKDEEEQQPQSDKMEADSEEPIEQSLDYQSKVDAFRQKVQQILDTPSREVKKPKKTDPSPRIDRITIQNKTDQQMEFLIPPKTPADPIEIRERIRQTLDITDDRPPLRQTPVAPSQIPGKSPSISTSIASSSASPVYNTETGLWSPNVPSYDAEHAEEVSKWLIFLIFSILTAVFCAYFQEEILHFFQSQMKPMGEIWESITSSVSSLVSSTTQFFESAMSANNETEMAAEDVVGDAAASVNTEEIGSVTK